MNSVHPTGVQQLSAPALKGMLDAGTSLELIDVRTPEERELASIEGARLLDRTYGDYILALPKDTVLVFRDGAPLMG